MHIIGECKMSSLFLWDGPLVLNIHFLAHETRDDGRIAVVFYILHPVVHLLEGLGTCYIIDQDYALHIFIVIGGDCPEPLLTRGVPDLNIHRNLLDFNCFLPVLHPESRGDIRIVCPVHKPVQHTWFTHPLNLYKFTTLSQHHYLYLFVYH